MAEVLITGGSGGIGAAVARRLAAAGLVPLLGYAGNAAAALAVAEETGGSALALDLTSPTAIDAAVAAVTARGARLSGLVLAASPPPVLKPFGQITEDEMYRQWRVNALGHRRLLAAVAKTCFRPHKRGTVVAVLSSAMGDGVATMPNMGAYIIAKYALAGVLAAAAAEYSWLKTATVRPGFTDTQMLDAFDPRFLEGLRQRTPFATPEQIAETIVAPILESET